MLRRQNSCDTKLNGHALLFGLLFVLVWALPSQLCHAKDNFTEPVATVDSLYKYGEIDRAEIEALNTLSRKNLPTEYRVHLEVVLASIYVARADSIGAVQSFLRALRIKPDLALNSATTSPKILAVFDAARQSYKPEASYSIEQIRLLEISYIRSQGYPMGYLVPGIGLIQQGKSTEGVSFIAVESITLAGSIYAALKTNQAKSDYRKATTDASSKWDEYQKWNRTANTFWIATGLIHAFGLADLALGPIPTGSTTRLALTPSGVRLWIDL